MSNVRDIASIEADLKKARADEMVFAEETDRQIRELRAQRRSDAEHLRVSRTINELTRELSSARDIASRTDAHPLAGQKVTKIIERYPRYGRRIPIATSIYGMVEMVTSETEFPKNTPSYRCPVVGAAIVRLIKADGEIGIQFERLVEAPNTFYGKPLTDEQKTLYWHKAD